MNHLMNITKKELRELLTPGSLISIIVTVLVLSAVGVAMNGEMDSISSPSKIGFIDGDDGEWSDVTQDAIYSFYANTYGISMNDAREFLVIMDGTFNDENDIMDAMAREGLTTAIGVGSNYSSNIDSEIRGVISEYYIFENKGIIGAATDSLTPLVIMYVSDYISTILVSEIVDADRSAFMLNPVRGNSTYTYINGEVHPGVTPMDVSTSTMGQSFAMPIVIMIVIVIIGGIVISSMGSEKENKTLETLLTLPVKRTTIVSGKLLAAAIAGLIYGLAYMVGMMFYTGWMTSGLGGTDLTQLGLTIGGTDWIIILIMMFLAIFCALGLCMIMGAFVKNYKTAQTMTLPISIMAMVPMFITMFSSWDSLPTFAQAIMFAIPFTHPMMIMDNLMFNNFELVIGGMIYLAAFTIITIWITVRIYKSDILLTGIKRRAGRR